MGLFNKIRMKQRAEPEKAYNSYIMNNWLEGCTVPSGYVRLVDSPEVKSGIEKIAEIVSLMTIHLMQNTEQGDIRLKNGLSRKIDIDPNKYMNRQLFISWVVQEMLLNGNAIVLPILDNRSESSYLKDLIPIASQKRSIEDLRNTFGYQVVINNKVYSDDEILNFRFNPDIEKPYKGKSQEIILRDFIDNLSQANITTKDFMENKMLPNVIVKVQGMTGDMDNEEGRNEIERRFLQRSRNGQPWIVPGEMLSIEQIKSVTLQDIAIDKTIKLNKESVASILGIPAFLLGVGTFNQKEYNNFIKSKISIICKAIEQELTKKIIISDDWYFKFNTASLLSYDLPEIANVYSNLYTKGIVTGNEVRDKLGMSTMQGLDELVTLENYIPLDEIGNQKKLKEKGGENGQEEIL